MKRRLLTVAARLWGMPPGERAKMELVARLGPRFVVSVWAVIPDEVGRVLLFRHTHDAAHPWGLPSGRLEARERPEDPLRREFREEVRGAIRPLRLVAALPDQRPPALRLVHSCGLDAPPCTPSYEVDAWRFFALDDLPLNLRPKQRLAIVAGLSAGTSPDDARF